MHRKAHISQAMVESQNFCVKETLLLLQQLNANSNFRETAYYEALEQLGDLITNCDDYMITEPINCDEELKRLPEADYEFCAALLTMLLREIHLFESLWRRYIYGSIE